MSGVVLTPDKELKCMKVSVSSRQNLKIPAGDAGWELFPTTGLQGFPAGSSRASEFFSAGCLRYLVIRGDAQRPVLRGRRLPKGHLSLVLPPCCARWQASMGLLQALPNSWGHSPSESRLFGDQPYRPWFYFKETALWSGEMKEERDVPKENGILRFSSYCFSWYFHYFKNSVSPNGCVASFFLIHLMGLSLPIEASHHSIFGHFPLKTLILALDSELTCLWHVGTGAPENSSSSRSMFWCHRYLETALKELIFLRSKPCFLWPFLWWPWV